MSRTGILMGLALCAWSLTAAGQEPPKDPAAATSSFGGIGGEGTGGPDEFGYTFSDSDGFSCAFQFVDITATGTSIVTGDDTSSGPITLGSLFDIYGTLYSDLVMATNGYLSTDPTDTGPDLSNDCPLPAPPSTGGGARLYPLHDDLVTTDGLTQFFESCPRANANCFVPEPCTVFQWNQTTHFGGNEPWNMQAILYHFTGDIVVQVDAGNPEAGSGSTTGLQNDGATIGLTYACNTPGSVPDGRAVCFRNPGPQGVCFPITCLSCAIPTMSPLGLLILVAALAGAAFFVMRRRLVS